MTMTMTMMMMMLMCRRRKMMMLRRRMLRRTTNLKARKHTLCEPARATCAWTFDKVCGKVQEKWPGTPPGTSFCASLRSSKCTWTFHNSHFVRKFTGKMP